MAITCPRYDFKPSILQTIYPLTGEILIKSESQTPIFQNVWAGLLMTQSKGVFPSDMQLPKISMVLNLRRQIETQQPR